MATLFLSQTIRTEEDKQFSDILNTVDASKGESKVLFSSLTVLEQYKQVSEVIQSVELEHKPTKKSMKSLMQQSFFHGKSWMGNNFIA